MSECNGISEADGTEVSSHESEYFIGKPDENARIRQIQTTLKW